MDWLKTWSLESLTAADRDSLVDKAAAARASLPACKESTP